MVLRVNHELPLTIWDIKFSTNNEFKVEKSILTQLTLLLTINSLLIAAFVNSLSAVNVLPY